MTLRISGSESQFRKVSKRNVVGHLKSASLWRWNDNLFWELLTLTSYDILMLETSQTYQIDVVSDNFSISNLSPTHFCRQHQCPTYLQLTRPHFKPYHEPMKYEIIEIISVRSIIVRNWLWITEAQRWNGVQQFYWEFLKSILYWQNQTDPTKVNLT